MKTLAPTLQARLDTGATTLCWCWRITRTSGVRLGFTDHDRDLTFDGTTFEAAAGFTASEIRDSLGLSVDDLEVESALSSAHLSETALAAGDFDDAAIEIFRVDWSDPTLRILMRQGSLGEVRRTGTAFTAEIRGLAHYLQQPKGRVYQYACDANLGDTRCGVNLTAPTYRGIGTVTLAASTRQFSASGLGAFTDGWFTQGLLTFTSGANNGRASEVKRHTLGGSIATLELWQLMAGTITPGDTFSITAGCNKLIATCRAKFANTANYRGFPHMPGNDTLASYASGGSSGSSTLSP
ncbi:MAG: DUF2163 domain-containing protein [Hyphomicrobiaceae bacterium]